MNKKEQFIILWGEQFVSVVLWYLSIAFWRDYCLKIRNKEWQHLMSNNRQFTFLQVKKYITKETVYSWNFDNLQLFIFGLLLCDFLRGKYADSILKIIYLAVNEHSTFHVCNFTLNIYFTNKFSIYISTFSFDYL